MIKFCYYYQLKNLIETNINIVKIRFYHILLAIFQLFYL